MTILELLKGKKVTIKTDALVDVILEIESVDEKHHSENLAPPTPANDWWPPTRDWNTYDVKFTNGYVKSYSNISEIKIIE